MGVREDDLGPRDSVGKEGVLRDVNGKCGHVCVCVYTHASERERKQFLIVKEKVIGERRQLERQD